MRPTELVQKWVESFNRHDAEALAAFYHEDATSHQVAQDLVSGREAIKAMLCAILARRT